MDDSTRSHRPTVLIVDDDLDSLALLSGLLKDRYHVKVSKYGSRALEIASRAPQPDLILLDVVMPEMDGHQVCRRLKENESTRDIPVIFLTAKNDVEDEMLGLSLGAVDYINKPASSPIVLARVATHIALKKNADFLRDKAAYLEQEVARRMRERDAAVQSLDDLLVAMVITDNSGQVIFFNSAAERFIASKSIDIVQGKLIARTTDQSNLLRHAISKTIEFKAGGGSDSGTVMVIEGSDNQPLSVLVCPLRSDHKEACEGSPMALVLISEPDDTRIKAKVVLARLYDLTNSEAALLAALVGGQKLSDYAAMSGITFATAKTHLSHIFQKVGYSRQADIIREVWANPIFRLAARKSNHL